VVDETVGCECLQTVAQAVAHMQRTLGKPSRRMMARLVLAAAQAEA
jgi:hypothetical protein